MNPTERAPIMKRLYVRVHVKGATGFYAAGWICWLGHTLITAAPTFPQGNELERVMFRRRARSRKKRMQLWV